ncbi:hypothetical protein NQ318_023306 [Aromia moschata]|uniref:C2H2-type domain-containing protein n=1 Tax=Aromia moschata TaxID=1265417 RepID=A0AAV8XST3_9CUCU|nr:hypothetical protein NQ318_023306 [Aromia moschata]
MEYVRVKIEPADERNETVETTMRDNSLLSTAEDEAGVEVKDKTNLVKTNKIGPNKTDRRKHGESITRCPECDFSTKYKYNLRRHLIVAHDRKDIELTRKAYKCTECDFATRWNLDLTRHMLSHVKPEAFRCTRCPYSTDENSHLVKHILSHLNNDDADKYSFLQTTRGW